jgi:hypothetical protein
MAACEHFSALCRSRSSALSRAWSAPSFWIFCGPTQPQSKTAQAKAARRDAFKIFRLAVMRVSERIKLSVSSCFDKQHGGQEIFLAGALDAIRLCRRQIAIHRGTLKFVKHPAGDVIYQYFRVCRHTQHGAAMRTAHRDTVKRRADQLVADTDLIQRTMGDRLFTFWTITVT